MNTKTWQLVNLPIRSKPIGYKCIFKNKLKSNLINLYKVKFVAKDYRKKRERDFFDTYFLITRITSTRVLMATYLMLL